MHRIPSSDRLNDAIPTSPSASKPLRSVLRNTDASQRTSMAKGPMGHRPPAPGRSSSAADPSIRAALLSGLADECLGDRLRGILPSGLVPVDITLVGFKADQKPVMEKLVTAVQAGFGTLFPEQHADVDIRLADLGDSCLARTEFHGKAASIDFDFKAHLDNQTLPVDKAAEGRMLQTMTHEVALHTLKEFMIYSVERKQVAGLSGHRDACLAAARENYFRISKAVHDAWPDAEGRAAFATEWVIEICDLARAKKTDLTAAEQADAIDWARRKVLEMHPGLSLPPLTEMRAPAASRSRKPSPDQSATELVMLP